MGELRKTVIDGETYVLVREDEYEDLIDSIAAEKIMARIRAGEFKALGVLQNDRLTAFPDIQTTVEVGSKNSGMPVWIAFFAPPGTPDAVMRKLESATRSASSAPAFVEFLHNNGVEPWNPSNQDLMRFIQDQLNRSGPIIQEIGLQPQ